MTLPSQEDVFDWSATNWPDKIAPIFRAAKLCEEAGEVMGAVIKIDEGRKTMADLRQETAQVVICALALAEAAGFDLEEAVCEEFGRTGWPGHDRQSVDEAALDWIEAFLGDRDVAGDVIGRLRSRGLLADRDPWAKVLPS